MKSEADQDWPEHKLLVMNTLQRLETSQDHLGTSVQVVNGDVQGLKYEAAFWGGSVGLITATVVVVLAYLKFHNLLKKARP